MGDLEMEMKEEFYDKVEQEVEKLPNYNTKIIIGNTNAENRQRRIIFSVITDQQSENTACTVTRKKIKIEMAPKESKDKRY